MRLHDFWKHIAFASSLCVLSVGQTLLHSQEWEQSSSYYEDDAWYDVTEWFDGDDYNSTNEATADTDNDFQGYQYLYDSDSYYDADSYGYDDNVYDYDYGYDYEYDYDEDSMGNPYSDASNYSWYGYDNRYDDDDWFYDYYDDGYSYYDDLDDDGLYDYSYRFHDWNNDGNYDAYSTYSDWDADGTYEDWNYYALNDSGNSSERRQQAQQQSSKQGKKESVTGEVTQTKRVSVGDSRNQIVQIRRNNNSNVFVDLGPANQLNDLDISKGDQLTVEGPLTKVGDKRVILAQNVKTGNNSTSIDRNRRKFSGKIEGMWKVNGRQQQNQIVILKNDNGKNRLVDLGAADQLNVELSQGDSVSVRGPLVKIGDRQVVLAQSLTHDGEQTSINRRQSQSNQQQRQSN